jgi:hypothetical protein
MGHLLTLFFFSFFFFPLWVQGVTSIRFRLSKQKLNYVGIGHAQNIIMVELFLLCLGQIISCDNLTLGKSYGINYEVHVLHHHLLVFDLKDSTSNFTHIFQLSSCFIISHISKSIAWALGFFKFFLFWSNFLKVFDRLWWVGFCISRWAMFYVCNFVTLFVFIC